MLIYGKNRMGTLFLHGNNLPLTSILIVSNMKFLILTIAFFLAGNISAQERDTIRVWRLNEVNVYKDQNAYWREVERVRKVYPYALHAAALLEKFDAELGLIDKKRKKKKYGKEAHKVLKEDYTYVIRDLYRTEGVLLMKLIHRETGLTASQIIKKYRGKMNSEIYNQLSKIWDQDMDVKYDPAGADWLTEQIILEIQHEMLEFTPDAQMVTKEQYKKNMEDYRKLRKEYRIQQKTAKKLKREKKRDLRNIKD